MSRFQHAILRAAATCAACLWAALPVAAQAPPPGSNALTFKVQAATERLEMTVSTSRIVEMPFKVPRVFVANPDIVRAQPLSPTQVQVSAMKPGVTQVNVWDEEARISTIDIIVYGDARELEMLLRSEYPDAQLKIRPLASSVYISGFVPKAEQVGQIVRMAEDYYPKVVNNISVGGVQQILLNVKVMEVSRTKLRQMGVDWSIISEDFFLTQRVSGVISNIDQDVGLPAQLPVGSVGDTVRFGLIGDTSFFGFLDLLRENNLAKLLAEPKITTLSGRPASFNVGGQVPIPIAQSLGTVTVQYKDFGTQIDFVPIALGNGNIRLEVRPEVTEVDASLRDATTGVPGFRRRFADTAVEMKAGQTMAIAGLIYQRQDSSNRGIPWLADLPWVGAAFRRTREIVNEVELVITVTPEFVEAIDCEEVPACGPGTMTSQPTDTELYYKGYIEVPNCDNSTPFCPTCPPGHGPHAGPHGPFGPESIVPPMYQKGAKAKSPTKGVIASKAAAPPSKQVGPPSIKPRSAGTAASPVSTRSSTAPKGGTTATGGTNTRRLPGVQGSTGSRLLEPVQASLTDEPELIGPHGYDRLR
jgi:pilus assembly protein CpaC